MGKNIAVYQSVIAEVKEIISAGREGVYNAANDAMILAY